MILLFLVTGLLAYVILYYQRVRRYPKGPFPLPLIGNLYHLKADCLHEYVHKIGKDYGHCFTLFLPHPVVLFTDFSTVKEALVTEGENFTGRSQLPPEIYMQRNLQTGIAIADGEVWREQRRVALKILRDLGYGKNLMEAQVHNSIDEMLHQLRATNDGVTPFDMNTPLQLCVGNVISETIYGYHFSYSEPARFEFYLHCATKLFMHMKDNFWVQLIQAWPWMRHLPIIGQRGYTEPVEHFSKFLDWVDEEVDRIAIQYDTKEEPTSFVEAYLVEMEKNTRLGLVNLRAIVVDIWIAASETTSTTLRWGLLLLMESPRVQEKMRAELLLVVDRGRRIEMADKPNLPYFNAAITEIQRRANIVPFTVYHRCTADSIIGGKLIPKDALTLPQIYSVMMDEEIFENPMEFRPERFLEDDGKTANKALLDHFVAFGLGKRQCLGEGLGRMELFLVFGTLLLNYRFEPTEPLDMTPIYGWIQWPRPYKCRVVPI